MAAGILMLVLGLVNEAQPSPFISALVVVVIFSVGTMIVYYCFRAYRDQQKEEEAIAKEGMFNDNRGAMNTLMGGAG